MGAGKCSASGLPEAEDEADGDDGGADDGHASDGGGGDADSGERNGDDGDGVGDSDGGEGGGGGGGGGGEAVGADCGGSVGIGIGAVDGDVGADSVGERVRDGGDGSVGAVCDGAFWEQRFESEAFFSHYYLKRVVGGIKHQMSAWGTVGRADMRTQ